MKQVERSWWRQNKLNFSLSCELFLKVELKVLKAVTNFLKTLNQSKKLSKIVLQYQGIAGQMNI